MPTRNLSFSLFDTAIGRCAIVWHEGALVAVALPERNEAATRSRLSERWPTAIERAAAGEARAAIEAMTALLAGERRDLSSVALDMTDVSPFERRVYEVARTIAPGTTLTYGEIAAALGDRGASRAVGRALGRNPFPIVVPCHRVVAAQGKSGGFSAQGGVATKLRLLAIEGAQTPGTTTLFP